MIRGGGNYIGSTHVDTWCDTRQCLRPKALDPQFPFNDCSNYAAWTQPIFLARIAGRRECRQRITARWNWEKHLHGQTGLSQRSSGFGDNFRQAWGDLSAAFRSVGVVIDDVGHKFSPMRCDDIYPDVILRSEQALILSDPGQRHRRLCRVLPMLSVNDCVPGCCAVFRSRAELGSHRCLESLPGQFTDRPTPSHAVAKAGTMFLL
jgi:hypothetical protein